MVRRFFILILLAISVVASAATADSTVTILERVAEARSKMWQMTPEAFGLPVNRLWMLPMGLSRVGVGYDSERLSEPVDCRDGEGLRAWDIGAESYLRLPSSTVWGTASYSSGCRLNPVWNESSDAGLIYPYFVADSIGGDMKFESYNINGGYAGNNGRWAWGVEIGYEAGLHFRNVDPRPRNVVGQLTLSASVGRRLSSGPYYLGVAVGYMKYKQSADIMFVNDLADTRIWHLTGLGTHYERFAGQGYSHFYDGHRWSGSVTLFPHTGRGLSLTATAGRFSFDHILSSLNKLPLQRAVENQLRFEAAWLQPGEREDYAVAAYVSTASRGGFESIFGDAAAGVYPKIGELEMYHNTSNSVALRGLWQYHPAGADRWRLAVSPSVDYDYRRQTYADPWRAMTTAAIIPSAGVYYGATIDGRWRLDLAVRCSMAVACGCSLDFERDVAVPEGMERTELDSYEALSRNRTRFDLSANLTRSIRDRYAIMLSVGSVYESYASGPDFKKFTASISFLF